MEAKNKQKSDSILTTLCDYGATLRSLKNDEYITLVFENYENGKDKMLVFSSKNVKSCCNKDKLLETVISYQL